MSIKGNFRKKNDVPYEYKYRLSGVVTFLSKNEISNISKKEIKKKANKIKNEILKKVKDNWYPIQASSRKKTGEIRYVKKEDLEKYRIAKQNYNSKISETKKKLEKKGIIILFELPSVVDSFKLKRDDENTNFKYFVNFPIQDKMDETVNAKFKISEHYDYMLKIINQYDELDDFKSIFIPNPNYITNSEIILPNEKCNIIRFNYEEFKENLKEKFHNDYKNIIYELWLLFIKNSIFSPKEETKNTFNKLILDKEKKRYWTPTKEKVNEVLNKMKDSLISLNDIKDKMEEKKLQDEPEHCDPNNLNKQEKKEKYKELKLEETLYKKYKDINKNDFWEKCNEGDFIFSPQDHPDYLLKLNCDNIIENDRMLDNDLKKKLKSIYESHKTKNIDLKILFNMEKNFDEEQIKEVTFNLLPEFMPEWYSLIINKKIKESLNKRQLILSKIKKNSDNILFRFIKTCRLFYIADPFILSSASLNNISWNTDINQTVITCLLRRDQIFKARLLIDFNKDNTYTEKMYSTYVPNSDDIFLGTFLITTKVPYQKDHTRKMYPIYLFYSKKNKKIISVDFRGNQTYAGLAFEHVSMFYLELNLLSFYHSDINKGKKLHFYRYKDTNNVFVSELTIDGLKERYGRLYKDLYKGYKNGNKKAYEGIEFLDDLTEYTLKKDEYKNFVIEKSNQPL